MKQNKMELTKGLAIHAVKLYYQSHPEKMYAEIKNITSYYKCHSRVLVKLHQRIHRLEMNNIIIRSVLSRQTELKQKLIIGKYQDDKSWISLSMSLYTSVAQLSVWHNDVLQDIENMMFYKIREDDIFSQKKILNIVYVLDQQIDFLENLEEHNQQFVDKSVLFFLKTRKQKYENLYHELQTVIETADENRRNTILWKNENEGESVSNIAKACNISQSSVSVYLLQIKKEILNKLDYADLISI